jgi:hypothetical protein
MKPFALTPRHGTRSASTPSEPEHQIPAHRPQDHLSGELPTFEGLILPRLSRLSPFRHVWGFYLSPLVAAATEPASAQRDFP